MAAGLVDHVMKLEVEFGPSFALMHRAMVAAMVSTTACSAAGSSSVARMQAYSTASRSRVLRKLKTSSRSCSERRATLYAGSAHQIDLSRSRRPKASRTGPRLTPIISESIASLRRASGANCPDKIAFARVSHIVSQGGFHGSDKACASASLFIVHICHYGEECGLHAEKLQSQNGKL